MTKERPYPLNYTDDSYKLTTRVGNNHNCHEYIEELSHNIVSAVNIPEFVRADLEKALKEYEKYENTCSNIFK